MVDEFQREHRRVADEIQLAILRRMSPMDRLRQAMRMNRTRRSLLAAGFRSRHPEWSEDQINRAMADRILYASTG